MPSPDDHRWTSDYVSTNGATAKAPGPAVHRLIVLGFITALAIPPVGLVVGIGLTLRPVKPGSRHGLWIILVSLLAGVVWVLILASGAVTSTDTTSNY